MVLKSQKVFDHISQMAKDQGGFGDVVQKVQGMYEFHIYKKKGGKQTVWTVDLKNGVGGIHEGHKFTPDAVFILSDDDFVAIINGDEDPQQLFMEGRMRVKGNMAIASRFTPEVLPPLPRF